MSYISDLIEGNLKSLTDMLKASITANTINSEELRAALMAEAAPVPAGGDIYSVSESTNEIVKKLQGGPDRDVTIIVKKILRSTKYAATTYYAVSGADNNPHHLPITRQDSAPQS
jgi:hypothetical protein